jgi:hypothetical protein
VGRLAAYEDEVLARFRYNNLAAAALAVSMID